MSTPQSPRPSATGAILVVFFACVCFWLYWVPMEIGSRLPENVQRFFDERPTTTLIVLLGGSPFVIVGLAIVAAATSAILLRPFVARSTARSLLESIGRPAGLGRVERFLIGLFKDERS
jgi:hypothetical protein